MTKADVLYGLDEVFLLNNGKYVSFKGWTSVFDKTFKTYVKCIEDECNVDMLFISYGPDRNQLIVNE
jgi:adenylosuccinate synthase